MFYQLLHMTYFLHRNIDVVLLPMLQMLYSSGGPPSQMYMLLIVILILSQNASFSWNIHQIILQNLPWYSDRLLKNTNLGTSSLT